MTQPCLKKVKVLGDGYAHALIHCAEIFVQCIDKVIKIGYNYISSVANCHTKVGVILWQKLQI